MVMGIMEMLSLNTKCECELDYITCKEEKNQLRRK